MQTKRRETAAAIEGARARARSRAVSSVKLVPTQGSSVGITLRVEFDPKDIGDERAKRVYNGLAGMLAGLFSPDEAAEFMQKLSAERAKLIMQKVSAQRAKLKAGA